MGTSHSTKRTLGRTGQRSLIRLLLEQRIKPLSQAQSDRISSLNLDQLQRLAIALLNFSSVSDLETWLSDDQAD
ncbi:DUF4351 domain-containing protein [Phormidesmis sp. 146-33]